MHVAGAYLQDVDLALHRLLCINYPFGDSTSGKYSLKKVARRVDLQFQLFEISSKIS